ncbi:hypothetical protein OCK74_00115 [Chitinophagaceae bacterium LB-8]|jgi:hypothetical protein|uniref:Uncharacterized protein n=1 Tax=Paraflavisolibacter caeni TaxID=2982496 RepID=A0A9X3B6N6_9BACT|nr:hypothetical protein [Paraflavisolibacter caeni]MCU7547491.1 hypothetical protein [Paraflavisolibacter caeni]
MNTAIINQFPNTLIPEYATIYLEAKLRELEDAYAECLGDNVDAHTLTMLWSRIKAIKMKLALNQ